MKLIEQSHEILRIDGIELIERAGRTCYKSEDKITEDSADKFVRGLIKRKHEAMIEHGSATVKFITNRGVTHEIVRHRLASYGQESTRYVNYKDEIEFIRPVWLDIELGKYGYGRANLEKLSEENGQAYMFISSCIDSESKYKLLIGYGWKPEQAREVLPNALKTEIVVTMDFRSWRHFLNLRAIGTTGRPHPQIQALVEPLLDDFIERVPAVFEDLRNG